MLEEATILLRQENDLDKKKLTLNAFNKYFIVSEDELAVLTSTSGSVDEDFFVILRRVKTIHGDCQVLLSAENQRLGTELMEHCSRQLNLGYQKLYRWIRTELQNLNLESPQINSLMRRALRALSERPSLFQGCLDSFAEAREKVLTDSFHAALTGSGSSTAPDQEMKPIEFQAHDPLRYIGDILAWTHSAMVSEREALENLFVVESDEFKKGLQIGMEAEPWSAADSEVFDGQKALGDLLNRDMAGVAKVVRQRVEQVLQKHEDPLLLYRISNLVNFYYVTFSKLLHSGSSLLAILKTLEDSAFQCFRDLVIENVASVNSELSSFSLDLEVPEFLDDALSQFQAILRSYDTGLTPLETRADSFQPVLEVALDPYLAICEKMSKTAVDPDNHIFLTNCILAAQATLSNYDFVRARSSTLQRTYETRTASLVDYQHAFFLHTSGVHPLIAALAPLEDAEEQREALTKAANLPALKPQTLSDASQTLDEFLPSAFMDAMDNLKNLSSHPVAQEITAEAADRFCQDFEFVEGKLVAIDEARIAVWKQRRENGVDGSEDEEDDGRIDEESGGPVLLKTIYPRTSGEIRVLLS